MLVAPSTSTPDWSLPTPCICTRNSVLMRREASLSPSPRAPASESISSMKMIDGFCLRAISNSVRTSLATARYGLCKTIAKHAPYETSGCSTSAPTHCSLSPIHLDTRSDDETDMNVAFASVASALAKNDLPVPGGCGRPARELAMATTLGGVVLSELPCHVPCAPRRAGCPSTAGACQ